MLASAHLASHDMPLIVLHIGWRLLAAAARLLPRRAGPEDDGCEQLAGGGALGCLAAAGEDARLMQAEALLARRSAAPCLLATRPSRASPCSRSSPRQVDSLITG